MKRCKRKPERIYLKTRLEVHRQFYKSECRTYTDALNSTKSSYYKVKIANADNNQLFRTIDSLVKVKRVPLLPNTLVQPTTYASLQWLFLIKDSEVDGQSALVLPNIKGHVCYRQLGYLPQFFHWVFWSVRKLYKWTYPEIKTQVVLPRPFTNSCFKTIYWCSG